MSIVDMLSLVAEKAVGQLSKEELDHVSSYCTGYVDLTIGRLADTAQGLGCLIANDEGVGSFQSNDSVSGLLFTLANCLYAVDACRSVALSADNELARRSRISKQS